MSNRPEDLTDDELRMLCSDLTDRIEALDDEGEDPPDSLLDHFGQVSREQSRRDALAARRAGRYSVTLDADGEELEYELKATTLEDAQAEAESGIAAMTSVTGQAVTIERYNAPIQEGDQ